MVSGHDSNPKKELLIIKDNKMSTDTSLLTKHNTAAVYINIVFCSTIDRGKL